MGRSSVAGVLRRVGVLAAVLLTVGPVSAQMDNKLRGQLTGFEKVGPNEYRRITGPTGGGTRAIVATTGGAAVTDSTSIAGKVGSMAVNAKANLTKATIVRMGARGLAALPGWGVGIGMGIAVWDLWDYNFRVLPKGDGTLIHDPGVPPVTESTTDVQKCEVDGEIPGEICAGSAGALAGALVGTLPAFGYPAATSSSCTVLQDSTAGAQGLIRCVNVNGNLWNVNFQNKSVTTETEQCPASIDPLDPANSIPSGAAPDADGKCRQARYHWDPISIEGAGQLGDANPAPFTDPIREDIVERGLNGGQTPEVSTRETTGPASETGTPVSTTTTGPNGTTTATSTPTYHYTYGGDQITVTTTTVTNTCVGAGACAPEDAIETTTEEEKPPTDFCEDHPESLACMKLGEPPDDVIPKTTQSIAFASEDLGIGGSCPPPVSLPGGQQISYQSLCDGVTQARPLIIAMGFLMAAGIMVGGFKLE